MSGSVENISVEIAKLSLRVGAASLMLTHGVGKLQMLLGGFADQFPDPLHVGPVASLSLVVFAEFVCTVCLFVGFMTRFATIPLMITMLVAIFNIHAADPWANKEMAVVYLLIFASIAQLGGGVYSVDSALYKKTKYRFVSIFFH